MQQGVRFFKTSCDSFVTDNEVPRDCLGNSIDWYDFHRMTRETYQKIELKMHLSPGATTQAGQASSSTDPAPVHDAEQVWWGQQWSWNQNWQGGKWNSWDEQQKENDKDEEPWDGEDGPPRKYQALVHSWWDAKWGENSDHGSSPANRKWH